MDRRNCGHAVERSTSDDGSAIRPAAPSASFIFFGMPTGMPISTYAEGRFSRLDPLIELELRGQFTCDIDEPVG
jgi:hypothetical protein